MGAIRSRRGNSPAYRSGVANDRGWMELPHFAFESGLIAEEGQLVLAVYAVRRFAWRSEEYGHHRLRDYWRRGLLVALVRQRKLGERIGVQRKRANALVGELIRLKWLHEIHREPGRAKFYQVGDVVDGKRRLDRKS